MKITLLYCSALDVLDRIPSVFLSLSSQLIMSLDWWQTRRQPKLASQIMDLKLFGLPLGSSKKGEGEFSPIR